MGILSYRGKDYAAAERVLREAVAAAPDYQPAHYYLGLTLRRTNRTDEGERELRIATDLASQQQGKGAPVLAQ